MALTDFTHDAKGRSYIFADYAENMGLKQEKHIYKIFTMPIEIQ